MAITDTRPEVVTEYAPDEVFSVAPNTVFGSGDHTVLGRLWIGAALLFGVAGWVVTALVGVHQISPDSFLSTDAAATMFTLGRTGLVLLVLVPLLLGILTLVVPLQVGANTIAFPRAATLAFWTWLLSGGVLIVVNCIDGGFGGGRDKAVDLMLVSLLGLIASICLATVCVLTTAITLRTPGMALDRVPATTWAGLVGGTVWLLSLPVLAGNIVLMYVDHRYGKPSDFGVTTNQWAQFSWVVGQPQLYAFVIPGLGIVTDILTTLTGRRQAHRGFVLFGIGAFGVLSYGAFAQPYFYEKVQDQAVWAGFSILIVLPTVLLLAAWATTMRAGKPRALSAIGLALVGGLLLLLAVVAGVLYTITDLNLRDSGDYSAGWFALVVAAGLAMGMAGLNYWATKIRGRFANEALGKLSVLLVFGGGVLAGLPLLVLGFANRFTNLADAADALNGIAVAGDVLLALALLVAIGALLTAPKGDTPADDAWGTGQTLEWATASPPVPGNFGELAVVRSPEPLLDAAEPSEEA